MQIPDPQGSAILTWADFSLQWWRGRWNQGNCMPFFSFPESCSLRIMLGQFRWKLLGHPLEINAPVFYHSPQLPPADLTAETRAVHTDLVSDHTLHGVDRLQAGGTHFFQHGLKKERLRLNNWIMTTWKCICEVIYWLPACIAFPCFIFFSDLLCEFGLLIILGGSVLIFSQNRKTNTLGSYLMRKNVFIWLRVNNSFSWII